MKVVLHGGPLDGLLVSQTESVIYGEHIFDHPKNEQLVVVYRLTTGNPNECHYSYTGTEQEPGSHWDAHGCY